MNNLIYVYCLSDSPTDQSENYPVEGIRSFMFNDFYVTYKYVSESDFSDENFKRNISDIKWLEAGVREHVTVINMVMAHRTVIPFNFGTIFPTEENLEKFIIDYSESFIDNFQHIRDKEEWVVKIYCDRKALSDQIDELSPEAAALETQIMASAPGKAFLLKRKKTDLIENEMDRICKLYGQQYYDGFRNLSDEALLNNLLPKDFTEREDTMILNATFLVNKNNVSNFDNTADALRKKDGNSGFVIETSGPMPPFSFISIKEKK